MHLSEAISYRIRFMAYRRFFVGGGGVEIWRLKLTSAKVEVEVEAELGKINAILNFS